LEQAVSERRTFVTHSKTSQLGAEDIPSTRAFAKTKKRAFVINAARFHEEVHKIRPKAQFKQPPRKILHAESKRCYLSAPGRSIYDDWIMQTLRVMSIITQRLVENICAAERETQCKNESIEKYGLRRKGADAVENPSANG
jgi:hypothetical protein